MNIAKKRPIHETMKNRNKLLPCKRLEKLHIVLIRYENIVAPTKAAPLESDGDNNSFRIKPLAISMCRHVTRIPEII